MIFGARTQPVPDASASWWTRPEVQSDRAAFDQQLAQEQARLSRLTYAAAAQAHPVVV
jgi:hypothetical protein